MARPKKHAPKPPAPIPVALQQPETSTEVRADALSPTGQALLAMTGASLQQLKPTPGAMKRWGMDRPDSILNAIPTGLKQQILALPETLANSSEHTLAKESIITRQDRTVRRLFWAEYENAHAEMRPMDLDKIVVAAGAPHWDAYAAKFAYSPSLLAWLMAPPSDYKVRMETAMEMGLDRLQDILELPLTTQNVRGQMQVNTGVGMLILQAIRLVDQRLHGGYTQRQVNVNLQGEKTAIDSRTQLSMHEIDKKLKELEQQLGPPAPHPPLDSSEPEDADIIDVKKSITDKSTDD